MAGYLPKRLGWVPLIAEDELLASWVWRIEAYFEVPGLLCADLGCRSEQLDHHPPREALRRLARLTAQSLTDMEDRCASCRSVFDGVIPAACPACLQEMLRYPKGLYLRRDWAHGLRTVCPRHNHPLLALPVSGSGMFRWREQGGCDFAHGVNRILVEEAWISQPNVPEWEELVRFEAAFAGGLSMEEWGGPASTEDTTALLKSLIPVLGQISSGSVLHVERLIPWAFARSSRLRGPVTCENFGAQPPDVRRLFFAALMATRFAPPERQTRAAARQTVELEDHSGGAIAIPLQLKHSGHDRRWYRQTAVALLASPAGHGALQLSGRAQRKALGALMRRGLAEKGDARVS